MKKMNVSLMKCLNILAIAALVFCLVLSAFNTVTLSKHVKENNTTVITNATNVESNNLVLRIKVDGGKAYYFESPIRLEKSYSEKMPDGTIFTVSCEP